MARRLRTSEPVNEGTTEMFFFFCGEVARVARPAALARLHRPFAALRETLGFVENYVRGRTIEDVLAELQADYESAHADWDCGNGERELEPRPQPPTAEAAERFTRPIPFDPADQAELCVRLDAVKARLDAVAAAITALGVECGRFKAAIGKLTRRENAAERAEREARDERLGL